MASALTLGSCGATNDTVPLSQSENQCKPGTALILMGDTTLDRRCGCTETARRFNSPVTGFTCTVAQGTVVYFNFDNAFLPHQVLSVGSPSFVSSPPYRRDDPAAIRMYAYQFKTAGTYSFRDSFDATLSGTLIIQ